MIRDLDAVQLHHFAFVPVGIGEQRGDGGHGGPLAVKRHREVVDDAFQLEMVTDFLHGLAQLAAVVGRDHGQARPDFPQYCGGLWQLARRVQPEPMEGVAEAVDAVMNGVAVGAEGRNVLNDPRVAPDNILHTVSFAVSARLLFPGGRGRGHALFRLVLSVGGQHAGIALGVLDLAALGAEVADQLRVDVRIFGVQALGQMRRNGPHQRAAVGAGLVLDGVLLQAVELFLFRMGRVPVRADAHGPGGAVMAAGGAQAAGILPDGDGVAAAVRQMGDVDGPGRADMAADAAAHAEGGIHFGPAAQARRRECFAQREGIGARALQQIAEQNFQKARHIIPPEPWRRYAAWGVAAGRRHGGRRRNADRFARCRPTRPAGARRSAARPAATRSFIPPGPVS